MELTRKKHSRDIWLIIYLHVGQSLIQKASNGKMTLKTVRSLSATSALKSPRRQPYSKTLSRSYQQPEKINVLPWARLQDREYFNFGFAELQRKLLSSYASVDRLNLNISDMKAMFHKTRINDLLEDNSKC